MLDQDVVVLLDENGKELTFDHLMTFKHLDKTYIALMAIDEVEGLGDDEVLLLEVVKIGEEDQYLPIESKILLEEVFDTFMDLFDEMLDEEEEIDNADSLYENIDED